MAHDKIAVIGDRDSVMLWQALGARVAAVNDVTSAERALHRFAREDAAIIYITEKFASELEEAIGKYLQDPEVSVIPIPDRNGPTGYGMRRIKANIEKAIGADILFGNEE